MHEDPYTGSIIDDGDEVTNLIDDDILSEFNIDDEDFVDALDGEDGETVVNIQNAADGARSLQEVAERLYAMADELLDLSADGWEILDDISDGHGVAIRFDVDGDLNDG